MNTLRATLILCASLCLTAQVAIADDSEQCIDLVRECFVYKDAARDNCFHSVAKHSFCFNSETSNLATRRAELSALVPNDNEAGPSLLGPQLVDRDCVLNFDNAWLGSLVKGAPAPDTYSTLRQSLEACARPPASDMIRP